MPKLMLDHTQEHLLYILVRLLIVTLNMIQQQGRGFKLVLQEEKTFCFSSI